MDTSGMLYCGSNEPVEELGSWGKFKRALSGSAFSLPIVKIYGSSMPMPRPAIPIMYDPTPDDVDGIPKARVIYRFLDNNETRLFRYRYYQLVDTNMWFRSMGNSREEYVLDLSNQPHFFDSLGLGRAKFLTKQEMQNLRDSYPDVYTNVIFPMAWSLERSLAMNRQMYKTSYPMEHHLRNLQNNFTLIKQIANSGNLADLRKTINALVETRPRPQFIPTPQEEEYGV